MTRLALTILIGMASLLGTLKLQAQADYSSTRLIIKLKADVPVTMQGNAVTFPDAPNKQNQRRGQKGNIQRLLRSTPTNARGRSVNQEPLLLTFNETIDIPAKMKELMATGLYEYVEPDYVSTIGTDVVPNDPLYNRFQWGPDNDGSTTYPEGFPNRPGAEAGADINMESAWGIAQGNAIITVAVIDTGIKLDHPEFAGRWWSGPSGEKGYDFFNEDSDPTDDNGHGTHVAGILGATGNNANLMAGVDWNCKLMALKTSGSDGNGFESQWVAAIYYAVDNGADVINMSLGSYEVTSAAQDAVDYATSAGVIIVAAAGNDDTVNPWYPAGLNGVIAVGAMSYDNTRASFSNFGSHLFISAPGVSIYSLSHINNTELISLSGTSQASPLVAGVVSVMKGLDPALSNEAVKTILRSATRDQIGDINDTEGWDQFFGHGLINAHDALLFVNPGYTANETVCNGFVFDEKNRTDSGLYFGSFLDKLGMDSTVQLTLTIQGVTTYETLNIVESVSYEFYGETLTASGQYTATTTNGDGCEHEVTLNLTISGALGASCENPLTASLGTISVDNSSGDQWHAFTATENGKLIVSTCGLTSEDTNIRVYDDCNASFLVSGDDNCLGVTAQATVELAVSNGTTYLINFRDIYTSGTYNADLSFQEAVPGLTCSEAILVQSGTHQADNSTGGAWFKYKFPAEGSVSVRNCDAGLDVVLNHYSDCGAFVEEYDDNDVLCTGEDLTTTGQTDQLVFFEWGDDLEVGIFNFTVEFTPTDPAYCDSFVNELTLDITEEVSYEFDGQTLTESGQYTAMFLSSHECDSTVTLNLTIGSGGECAGADVTTLATTGIYEADNSTGDHIFKYVAEKTCKLIISSIGINNDQTLDTELHLSTDCENVVGISDDFSFSLQSRLNRDVTIGDVYYIIWKATNTNASYSFQIGYNGEEETFACDKPALISEGSYYSPQTLGTQYYQFTMPSNGSAHFYVDNEATLTVYEDANCSELVVSEYSEDDFTVIADGLIGGSNYKVEIEGHLWIGFELTYYPTEIIWESHSWSNGTGPTAQDDVVIADNYNTGTDGVFSCQHLIVNELSTLTVNSGTTLNIMGDLTNNGAISVESGASLLTYETNTIAGNVITFKRNTRYANGRYSFVGSPVLTDTEITGSDLGPIVYSYNETVTYNDGTEDGADRWVNASTMSLQPGLGYAQAGQETIIFEGIPNDGSISFNGLSRTQDVSTTPNNWGWHLVSNPYPAAIDLQEFINGNVSIQGFVALWDDPNSEVSRGDNGDYLIANSLGAVSGPNGGSFDGYIGSMQGFFIQVGEGQSGNLVFNENMRVADQNADINFFRKENSTIPSVKLAMSDGDQYSETLIGFPDNATEGIDRLYDATKLRVGSTHNIYSRIDEMPFAIQGLPFMGKETRVSLGYDRSKDGLVAFRVIERREMPLNYEVILLDKQEKVEYRLTSETEVELVVDAGKDQTRFELIFRKTEVLGQLSLKQSIKVYSDDAFIHIVGVGNETISYRLINLMGQVISSASHRSAVDNIEIAKPSVGGMHLLLIESAGRAEVHKLIFR